MAFLQKVTKGEARKNSPAIRECNICQKQFRIKKSHQCFCDGCRENSEDYKFGSWMPMATLDDSDYTDIFTAA